MREQLFADIVNRDLPLSHKQVKCLKSLTRSAGYLSRMKGASRYDLQGMPSTVTAEEAQYASERMMKSCRELNER
jgi:sRNA-binding protein